MDRSQLLSGSEFLAAVVYFSPEPYRPDRGPEDDGMAIGAKKAFQELPDSAARQRWLSLPFVGCDGLPKTGQAWVKRGLLTATIFAGPTRARRWKMLVKAFQSGIVPPENTLTAPASIPPLDALAAMQAEKSRLLSV